MLASSEIFGIPIFLILVIGYYLLKALDQAGSSEASTSTSEKNESIPKEDSAYRNVALQNHSISLPLQPIIARESLKLLVEKQAKFTLVGDKHDTQRFLRGDFRIKKLPVAGGIDWEQFPVTLTLKYLSENGATTVLATWESPEEMEFDEACKDLFYQSAAKETDLWQQAIVDAVEQMNNETAAGNTEENESDVDNMQDDGADDDAEEDEDGDEDDDGDEEKDQDDGRFPREQLADYEELEVHPRARWDEIQASYRRVCRQYHPDRLEHQAIPLHLIELAVRKFKSATAAYQRLRRRHGK